VHARIAQEGNQRDRALVRIDGGQHHGVRTTLCILHFGGRTRVGTDQENVDDSDLLGVFLINRHRRGGRRRFTRQHGDFFRFLGIDDVEIDRFFYDFHRVGAHAGEHVYAESDHGQYNHQQHDQHDLHDF